MAEVPRRMRICPIVILSQYNRMHGINKCHIEFILFIFLNRRKMKKFFHIFSFSSCFGKKLFKINIVNEPSHHDTHSQAGYSLGIT